MELSKCNMDCFNCIYDDCINDDMTAQDYRDSRELESEIIAPKNGKQKRIAAYQRKYRETNKDSIAAHKREYREANKDSIAAYQRKYREANKDSIAAYKRKYREANKDSIAAHEREYYEANQKRLYEKQHLIKIARKAHGYTQKQIASMCGVTAKTISHWETGRAPCDEKLLTRFLPELKEVFTK